MISKQKHIGTYYYLSLFNEVKIFLNEILNLEIHCGFQNIEVISFHCGVVVDIFKRIDTDLFTFCVIL